ncbi:hypothetical protein C3L33_15427, partial [Rhododendron williamsianum]
MRVEKWRPYLKMADLIREQAKLVLEALKSLGKQGFIAASRIESDNYGFCGDLLCKDKGVVLIGFCGVDYSCKRWCLGNCCLLSYSNLDSNWLSWISSHLVSKLAICTFLW